MLLRISATLVSVSLLSGCSGSAAEPTVLYDGAPTDEALEQMLALPVEDGPELTILAPTEDEEIDAEAPLTVSFEEGTARLTPGARRRAGHSDHWLERAVQALGVTAAHAHGTPYNGVAYLLEFADGGQQKRLQVFTDAASFTIPEAEWAVLADSDSPITLTIYSATFEENDVVAEGGPFERAQVTFTID
jgi:hypothetical protein